MRNRAIAAAIFLLGILVFVSIAHSQPLQPKNDKTPPFQGAGGRDVSQSIWQSWQAPVGTVDPDRLIPNESTGSKTVDAFPQYHSDSLKSESYQLANAFNGGTPIQVEEAKSIEKMETGNADSAVQSAPALATAGPKAKSNSRWIVLVACLSVGVLAYRKFRRANAGPYPPKPNFL
jgi:hypothetical protein